MMINEERVSTKDTLLLMKKIIIHAQASKHHH
uniref:Uncharacterized protein n=1 Tax=Bacillus cereus HuA4-10 TaxID=1053206 RepID=J8DDC1_BACCE|nr:hypothetical protein IGC_03711 [Bacillus cereus HuA4-10]